MPDHKRINVFLILILAAASVFFIFFKFNVIPRNLNYDEIDFAKLALSLKNKSYSPYSPQATGHATLYFYLILFSFELFGVNNFALRFPSALFGFFCVILMFFVMKKIFRSSLLAFVLSFAFLTSHWFLNFSRFSFEATFLLFLELASILFLIKDHPDRSRINIIVSGIFAGLAFNSYTPGRIFFILPLSFLILNLGKIQSQAIIKNLLIFLIPAILISLPLSAYFLNHKDLRVEQQFYPTNIKLSGQAKLGYFSKNVKNNFLMFFQKGDMNGRHNFPGKPAINPIQGIFFAAGLVIALNKFREPYTKLFIIYFLLSILPTLFTSPIENPNMLRTYTILPSLIYFMGIFLAYLKKSGKIWFSAAVFFILLLSPLYEIRTYFSFQSRVFKNSFEIKCPIEELIKESRPYPKKCRISRNEF